MMDAASRDVESGLNSQTMSRLMIHELGKTVDVERAFLTASIEQIKNNQ
jgi:hypothetical protein